jgi:hypothetical protein
MRGQNFQPTLVNSLLVFVAAHFAAGVNHSDAAE